MGRSCEFRKKNIQHGQKCIKKVSNIVNNTDEQKVLEAKYVAFYKGKLVIKIPGNETFSYGVIFMGNDISKPDLVKHEYGHTIQLKRMGLPAYTLFVAVPSTTCYALNENGKLPWRYYNSPFEYQADMYGGVVRENYYEPWAHDTALIYNMIAASSGFFINRMIPYVSIPVFNYDYANAILASCGN